MGFSRQNCWSGLPFPCPVDHVLSEFSTMSYASWVALHGMTHNFIELHKAVIHVIILFSFLWLRFPLWRPCNWSSCFLMSALWWMRIRGLCKFPAMRDLLWGKLGLSLVGRVMLSKSFIQFSANGGAVLPPCRLAWGGPVLSAVVSMLGLQAL